MGIFRLRTRNLSSKNHGVARKSNCGVDLEAGTEWESWWPTQKRSRAEIARAVFEQNAEAVFKAFSKALLRGNAYCFKEWSDRAYGKLKETHQVDMSPYKDVPTEDLAKQIEQLEIRLGYRKPEDVLPPASGNSKPN